MRPLFCFPLSLLYNDNHILAFFPRGGSQSRRRLIKQGEHKWREICSSMTNTAGVGHFLMPRICWREMCRCFNTCCKRFVFLQISRWRQHMYRDMAGVYTCVVSGHLVRFRRTDGGSTYTGESGTTGVFTCTHLCFDMR